MLLLVFQSGDLVDQYQVLRLLGQGGVGEVWLARDQVLGRKVALKVLRADLAGADDQRSLSDLLAEAQANAAVVHPHVVTVYAVGSHRGAPYLALEFIDGVTLRERITARAPTTPEALRFARDIASAVTAAHATGVLHLDLKPDNVLLAQDGRLRVVDFGLARLRRPDDDDDRAGTSIAGTPAYMPPEVWRGERPTEAADAWAFGVLLCELLAGRKPYTHETAQALVAALYAPVETPVPTLPTDVPGDVRGLLPRLLAKDATRRPAFAEVERVLAAALGRSRAHTGQDNPYCGLHAFREDDAARYFGRDDEIEAFVARLERAPVLPVVGHSGAGKSSFVRAGVIPRLREREPCLVVELR
ncbi:MAG: serine/threonine protein kinase, partial [Deltaproteobacteria bacterium]|nr:serine/threonine protein kinase [Deltaproteobacteria bacterium]